MSDEKLNPIFGRVSWTPPPWLVRAGAGRIMLWLIGALVLLGLVLLLQKYQANKPQPPTVVASADVPAISSWNEVAITPSALFINFDVVTDPRVPSAPITSVAAISDVGEVVVQGVSIEPAIEGEWRWQDERRLRFVPLSDWPADTRYTVRYDASLLAPNLRLDDPVVRFTTLPFTSSLDALEFHQDPVKNAVRKVIASLSFSHPIDETKLNANARFALREANQTVRDAASNVEFSITLGPHGRTAYLHTVPVQLPMSESYMTFSLGEDITQNVRIPDRTSFFKVNAAQGRLVRNDDDDPVQTLALEFSDRVSREALGGHLEAYVLPVSPNIDGQRFRNKYWQGPREVTQSVLDQSRKVALTLNAVEGVAASLHSAAVDLPDNAWVYVRVTQGLTSEGDFALGQTFDAVVRMPAYPKEARIAQSGALLPLTGSHQLTLVSRGVSRLKVDIGRVLDKDINHLASQTGGDIRSPRFANYLFDEDNLTSRTERMINVGAGKPSEAAFAQLDMTEFLPQGGYYLVTVQGWDRGHRTGGRDQRLVLITDIGLLVKTNADSSQDVFVHSLATGQPLGGARVSLLGKNGLPVLERATNADGHATLPETSGYRREKTPTVFVVRNGPDQIFMPFERNGRMLQLSRFDVGGYYGSSNSDSAELRAQVFTDRDLYRPGETVNLAGIVKRDDWGPLGALPIGWRIVDPRGNMVLEHRERLPGGGLLEIKFATEAASPTGNYTATLFAIEANNRERSIGNVRFSVEEFQPDRLRINASLPGASAAWIKPADVLCDVQLDNLFGSPAQGRRVSATAQLQPAGIRLKQFSHYRFDDPLRKAGAAPAQVALNIADTQTDDDGHAQLALDLARFEQGIYQLRVTVEGFEEGGGRSVKTRASVMMSPLDYLVGYRSDSDLAYLQRDSEHTVELIAVDASGSAVALDSLTRSVVAYRYVSTLVKRPNGSYAYQSVRKETPLSSSALDLPRTGMRVALPTDQPGAYAMLLSDASGRVYSKVEFTVAGARNVMGDLERDAQLTLNLNGSSFEPGDDIEMEIVAPFTGTGLITIETDRVLTHRWFQADTTTTLQRIRVPDDLEGNAYVNVAFVRDLNSPEVFVSPLSYAVAPFSISRAARTLKVELNVPERVKPGDELNIEYASDAPGRMLIFAVDEGILQVAGYTPPSPLDFFLRKRALQVRTFQMVDLILPEFEDYARRAAPGGGDGADLAQGNLNPFRRRNEAPVAYWSGVLASGPQTQTVKWRVPDHFDGQLRIMAVAVNDRSVGRAETSALVRGPFVLTPNVLTAAAPGDEFDINVGVANQLEGSGTGVAINVEIDLSEHLEVVGEARQSITLDEGREGRTRFRLRALDVLGAAEISIAASAGEVTARRRATLSVRPAAAYVSTLQAGAWSGTVPVLTPERQLYPAFASQEVAASVSPLILADGLQSYLETFPHACAEQVVSKVFPLVGLMGHVGSDVDEAGVRDSFAEVIAKLRPRQTPEGGFRFWLGSVDAAEFPSVYILHFLTDAKERGLPAPRAMLQAGRGYLQTLAGREVTSLDDARLRAYAIYVLTRNELVTTGYLTNLHEYLDKAHADDWRQDLVGSYLAASYALLQQDALGAPLIAAYEFGAGNEAYSDFNTRLGRDAQHVYLVARHFPNQMDKIDSSRLQRLIDPIMGNRFNTLSAAYTILALGEVTRAQANSGELLPLTLRALPNTVLAKDVPFARAQFKGDDAQIELRGNAQQTAYVALTMSGYDRQTSAQAQAEGLELDRQYLDGSGKAVTRAEIGDELTVRLRVRGLGAVRTNVAVNDLLPGGFEVLTDTVQRQFGGWQADYVDVREDRVVLYGSFGDRVTELRYQVKVTSAGRFVIPSAFAGSMYDRAVHARTASGSFEVLAQ